MSFHLRQTTAIRAGVCLLLCGLQVASADGFRNPPPSASALGRVGGYVAHIDDASAAALNPANLPELRDPEVMASITLGYGRRRFHSAYGPSERSGDPWAYLPGVFAALPLADERIALGFSVTVPFGRFTRYDRDAFFGEITPYESSLRVIRLNPALGFQLLESLSVGAGISYYHSELDFKYHPGIRFDGDGDAVGYNLAATWRPSPRQKVALTFQAPFDIDYRGDFSAEVLPPEALAAGATPTSRFRTRFNYPPVLAFGYGVALTGTLRAEIGVEWVGHSRNRAFSVDIDNNNILLHQPPSPEPLTLPQEWHDNWTVGFGLDWRFAPDWTVRAGYLYLESPTPARTTIPVAAERDQSVLSTGLGFKRGAHSLDGAYLYGWLDPLTVQNHVSAPPGVASPLDGRYTFNSHLLALAYAYRF